MPASSIESELAALREAYAREQRVRDYALLDLPHEVCGFVVRAMRLRDYLMLNVVRNPFVAGGYRRLSDCAQLLWLLSPRWRPLDRGWLGNARTRLARYAVCRRVARLGFLPVATAIDDFMDEMFMDAPGSSKDGGPPTIGFAASIISLFRKHWTRAELLEMPLPELWQYIRALNSDGPQFNKFSDRAKSRYLEALAKGEACG